PAFFRAIAERYGDKEALVHGEESLSYRDLERESAAVARGLLARGAGKGSRIGLLFANSPTFVATMAAIMRIGALAVPLSTFFKGRELGWVIRHADLHGLVAQRRVLGQDFVAHLEKAFPGLAGSAPDLVLSEAPFLRWI